MAKQNWFDGTYLEDVGDGFIVCIRKGQGLTDVDRQELRELRDFLRMTPEEQAEYARQSRETEGEDG